MTDPEDESLADWAARRERDRAEQRQKLGTRRVVPLSEGARASHIAPDAPRLLLEWDGTGWTTCGVAANADAAREFLGHVPEPEADEDAPPGWPGLGPGRGRHRKS
ncbi:DUF6087 family protein [Streptomyces sp. NPDC094038]|uniref:DUF6087 family protein n=1 Tax=Streptomyces sp. NPDC094038 TaxID=3366055 RepID=UPI00380EE058